MPGSKRICLFLVPIEKLEPKIKELSDQVDSLEFKIKEWYDQVYKYIVKPAAEECGYEAIRSDELPGTSEPIPQKISRHLRKAEIVVADLTWLPAVVFYELGFRRARRKPAIQLIQKGDKIPFDVRDFPTIEVDLSISGVKKSKKELVKKIKETEKEVSSKTSRMKKKFQKVKSS